MNPFGVYGRYYDQIYRDKDYAAEGEFVHALIQQHSSGAKTILDLGCGTGLHAIEFVRQGYSVVGVDRSEEMLAAALARSSSLTPGSFDLSFRAGDIRYLRLEQSFDVVVALFHVMSYQVGNDEIASAFKTARAHLRSGGLFIFDCWYGPGVLTNHPGDLCIQCRVFRVTAKANNVRQPNAKYRGV